MGYNKAVIYGDSLELYTYEKDIQPIGGKRSVFKDKVALSLLDLSRVDEDRAKSWKGKRFDNKSRTIMAFRRLVSANMVGTSAPLLVTCTYSENQTNLRVAYKDFHAFIRTLRIEFGKDFRYITVPEFQKRGAIHFHSFFWGLPSDLSKKERSTRLVARSWGKGFVDVYLTDGDEKLVSYLAKYMSKGHTDFRLFGFRAYRCSRNISRPIVEKRALLSYLDFVYDLGGDNQPCKDIFFNTQWLGKGRYRLYKINRLNIPNGNQN